MAIKFSKEQVLDRLKFENPWWETTKIDEFYSKMKRREYFRLLFPLITERRIKRAVVLMGPRRVGKTVLLFHCIEKLLSNGVNPKNICYFSIETPLYNGIALEELLNLFLELNNKKSSVETYVFFDEIQYLKDWELHLKSLVDSYHNVKFVVSGSAAAALKLKSQESGAGRFTEFILPPLTFHEFLSLTNNEDLIDKYDDEDRKIYKVKNIEELNQKFLDYINFGGYPELSLSEAIQSDPGRYIRNDIIDKVLMRDLPSLYGINDVQELNSLFTYIAYNSGNEMSLESISQNSGVAKNTIKKYITYLEAAFLIKVIHRIDQNGKKFKRANFFKIYLTNPSLRSALFSPIEKDDEFMGNMVETAIFAQWQHSQDSPLYYARWNSGEIDIVSLNSKQKPDWCIEIKWSNRFAEKPFELKNAKLFCNKHNLKFVMITTIDIEKTIIHDGVEYDFLPASQYCYTVGKNLIDGRKPKPE
jgi:predicted AAA+ superfamily ATPase